MDFQQILDAYRFRGYDKGVRGIHMRLLHIGIRMNPKKIRRLMRKYKLFCTIRKVNPYRRLQRAIRTNNTSENLVNREFEAHGPRSILLTDINNDWYQWDLAKLSPNEYYVYLTTGAYPLFP